MIPCQMKHQRREPETQLWARRGFWTLGKDGTPSLVEREAQSTEIGWVEYHLVDHDRRLALSSPYPAGTSYNGFTVAEIRQGR